MLHRIAAERPARRKPGEVSGVVLVPTRELAMQVAEAVHKYGKALAGSVLPLYGGAPMHQQVRALQRGVDVVVGTPGRVLDHIRRETLKLAGLQILVLDEADEMLDMGFSDDLDAIFAALPEARQTALFSATMPPRILQITKRHLKDPVRVTIESEKAAKGDAAHVRQVAYVVQRAHKPAALARIIDMEDPVAIRTSAFCDRNRPITLSRCRCSIPPCSASARWPCALKVSTSDSTSRRVRQNTSVATGSSMSMMRASAAGLCARETT